MSMKSRKHSGVLWIAAMMACCTPKQPSGQVAKLSASSEQKSASATPSASAPPVSSALPAEPEASTPQPEASPPEASPPEVAWSPCRTVVERAREELLERGFSPTRDTAHWLTVDAERPGEIELSIVMRQSADGAQTSYSLEIVPGAPGSLRWQKRVKPVCCDDNAAPEDHLKEIRWTRRHARQSATVSVVYFADVKTATYLAERELFAEVAKRAADKCLDEAGSAAATPGR